MADIIKVWECEGCGRIDHPQPCIGVCRDRKAELVRASDYRAAEARIAALEEIVRRIAFTHPRPGEERSTWDALQSRAREALKA